MRKITALLGAFLLCAVLGQAQNSTSGTLSVANAACVSGSCVLLKFDAPDVGSATISLSGTFTATVQFEASSDGLPFTDANKIWVAISGIASNDTTSTKVSSATTANTWTFNAASRTDIRARCSAFTSAPTVVIRSSKAVANVSGGGAVYASGLGTLNVIPKGDGAGKLADSSITDNGTTVVTTEPVYGPIGAVGTPTYSFTGNTNTGWWSLASNGIFGSVNGVRVFVMNNTGLVLGTSLPMGWSNVADAGAITPDLQLNRLAAASLLIGRVANASPVAQTVTCGESSRAATDSNVAGSNCTLAPGIGTGLGAGTKLCLQRDLMGATGSTAQNQRDGYCVGPSKTLSNTTATAQSLVNISVPSNSAGGVEGTITVTCTDGTNFDSETQSFNTSFVNKATVLTVTAPVITSTSAANNSGSCTAGITAVAGTNSVDIKVTPAFTTIVPTTVTSYITLRNNGTGNVTFN